MWFIIIFIVIFIENLLVTNLFFFNNQPHANIFLGRIKIKTSQLRDIERMIYIGKKITNQPHSITWMNKLIVCAKR